MDAQVGHAKSFHHGLILNRPSTDPSGAVVAGVFYSLVFLQVILSFVIFASKNSDVGSWTEGDGHILGTWTCPSGMIRADMCPGIQAWNHMDCITQDLCEEAKTVCVGTGLITPPPSSFRRLELQCKDEACSQNTWEFLEAHVYLPTVLFGTVFVLSVVWLFLMQHFARTVVWGTIITNLLFLVFVFVVCLVKLEVFNFMCVIFALAGAALAFILRKQIDLSAVVLKAAMDGLANNKRLFPMCFLITAIWAAYFALWIASMIGISFVKTPINENGSCRFVTGWTSNLTWLWIVTYYWTTFFMQNTKLIVLTANLSGWYFQQDGFKQFWRLGFKWAFTSLAGGNAICSAILGATQYLMRYQSSKVRLCLGLFSPIEWVPICLSFALKQCIFTYTKFGLIAHTFTGEPFCMSAQKAFTLLKDKIGEGLMTDFIGTNVMAWCTWILSLGVAFSALAWGESLSLTDGLLGEVGFGGILGIGLLLAFFVSNPFLSLVVIVLIEQMDLGEGTGRAILTMFFVAIFCGAITYFILQNVSQVVVNAMDIMFFNFAIEADHAQAPQDRFAGLYDAIDKLKTAKGVPAGQVVQGNAVATSDVQTMQVQVPEGVVPGQKLQVQAPHGAFEVEVPAGLAPGSMFQVQIPAAQPAVVATPAPAPVSVIGQPMQETPVETAKPAEGTAVPEAEESNNVV